MTLHPVVRTQSSEIHNYHNQLRIHVQVENVTEAGKSETEERLLKSDKESVSNSVSAVQLETCLAYACVLAFATP